MVHSEDQKIIRGIGTGMKNKKISVIIPCYNDYDWLNSCLLPSIARQTIGLENLEVIVVDDGTELKNQTKLPSWVLLYTQEHKGGNYARNLGTKNATGEYLIYPDADCELFPNCLQTMYDYLERNLNVHFIYSHFLQVSEQGWITKFHSLKFTKDILEQNNYISVVTMIRRESLLNSVSDTWTCSGPWNEQLSRFQDWELWIRLSRKGYNGYLIPEPLFIHFMRKKAISQSYKTYEQAKQEMFELLDGKRKYDVQDASSSYGSVKVVTKGKEADAYVKKMMEMEEKELKPSTGEKECKETFKG